MPRKRDRPNGRRSDEPAEGKKGRDPKPPARAGAGGGERRPRGEPATARRGKGGKGRPSAGESSPAASEGPLRLQAFLARAGVASRRASEELIRTGRVTVNGKTVIEMGTKVDPQRDRVYADGQRVEISEPVWVMLNKPKGYVTTRDDPSGRRTVYDLLPPELHPLFHVGRLDRNSEGLLLLTNEGQLANRLLHPRYGVTKEYVVLVEGLPERDTLRQLVEGVEVEGETLYADTVQILDQPASGVSRLRLVLREGRNREVRRMLEAVGHPVQRLVRKRFGPLRLGQMRRGEWRRLTPQEIEALSAGEPDDIISPR
jgi:23S rRNA pseudouridine2605 synthase